jgi:hypothetical protein
MEVCGQFHVPAHFTSWKRTPYSRCACLDNIGKKKYYCRCLESISVSLVLQSETYSIYRLNYRSYLVFTGVLKFEENKMELKISSVSYETRIS